MYCDTEKREPPTWVDPYPPPSLRCWLNHLTIGLASSKAFNNKSQEKVLHLCGWYFIRLSHLIESSNHHYLQVFKILTCNKKLLILRYLCPCFLRHGSYCVTSRWFQIALSIKHIFIVGWKDVLFHCSHIRFQTNNGKINFIKNIWNKM